MKKRRACIVCGKSVECDEHFAYGAVIFSSHGNYGSTVLDANGFRLDVLIHDACLLKRLGSAIAVIKHEPRPAFEFVAARYSKKGGLVANRRVRK